MRTRDATREVHVTVSAGAQDFGDSDVSAFSSVGELPIAYVPCLDLVTLLSFLRSTEVDLAVCTLHSVLNSKAHLKSHL